MKNKVRFSVHKDYLVFYKVQSYLFYMEKQNIDEIYNQIMLNLEKLDLIIKGLLSEQNEKEHSIAPCFRD